MSSEGRYDSPSQISLEKQTAYKILMRQGKAASPEDVEKLYRGEIGFVYTDDNPEEGYLVVGNNQSSIKVLDNTIVL